MLILLAVEDEVAEGLELEVVLDPNFKGRHFAEVAAFDERVRDLVLDQDAEDVVPVRIQKDAAIRKEVDRELDSDWCVHMPILLRHRGLVHCESRNIVSKIPREAKFYYSGAPQ